MIEVKLPDIGEGIAEGEVVQWLVSPGDRVEADQALIEVLTDKASVEIPAPESGVISQLLCKEGDLVPVGSVIAHLGHGTESSAPQAASRAEAAASAPRTPSSQESSGEASPPAQSAEIAATPALRRLARELHVDLRDVQGSGAYGRILREDIEAAAKQGQASKLQESKSRSDHHASEAIFPALPHVSSGLGEPREERIPLRGIRRKISDQMVKAKFTAPDFMFADEADLTELVAFRKSIAPELKAEGIKMTYLPFVIKAVISALKAYPTLNASLDDEAQEIVLKKDYHIGFATASPHGLFVPVIHHADRLSLIQLAQEIQRLAEAVREGKATSEEMRGGTFTITNIGAIGGIMSAPIINHPEVAILGLNKIYQKPMVYRDEIAIRWACTLSLSFDHRVVDGADGAYFTQHIMRLLQKPNRLLLEV